MSLIISVLKISSFRNLYLGQIFSQLSVNALSFLLIVSVYQRTASNSSVSLLILAIGIPALTLGAIAGAFVDQLPKAKVLFWTNLLRAFFLIALIFSHQSLLAVYFLAIIISIITQFFVPAEVPLIPQLTPRRLLLTANSLFTLSYYASLAIGFIASGFLISLLGEKTAIFVITVKMFLATYFVHLIPIKHKKRVINIKEISEKIFHHLYQGFSFIKEKKDIAESIIIFSFSQVLIVTLASLSPGFADKVLKIELTDASIIVMTPIIAGLVLSSIILGQFTNNRLLSNIITIGLLGSGCALAFLSLLNNYLSQQIILAISLFFFFGMSNAAIIVPVNTYLQIRTPETVRSRVYGVIAALGGGASILPVVGAGRLADRVGVGETIFIFSLLLIGYGVYRLVRESIK